MNKPVVKGKASICEWEGKLLFRTRKQVNDLINLLTKEDVEYDFCLEKDLDETSELYVLTVVGSAANNLVRVSRLASQVDYSLSLEEEYEN